MRTWWNIWSATDTRVHGDTQGQHNQRKNYVRECMMPLDNCGGAVWSKHVAVFRSHWPFTRTCGHLCGRTAPNLCPQADSVAHERLHRCTAPVQHKHNHKCVRCLALSGLDSIGCHDTHMVKFSQHDTWNGINMQWATASCEFIYGRWRSLHVSHHVINTPSDVSRGSQSDDQQQEIRAVLCFWGVVNPNQMQHFWSFDFKPTILQTVGPGDKVRLDVKLQVSLDKMCMTSCHVSAGNWNYKRKCSKPV